MVIKKRAFGLFSTWIWKFEFFTILKNLAKHCSDQEIFNEILQEKSYSECQYFSDLSNLTKNESKFNNMS